MYKINFQRTICKDVLYWNILKAKVFGCVCEYTFLDEQVKQLTSIPRAQLAVLLCSATHGLLKDGNL